MSDNRIGAECPPSATEFPLCLIALGVSLLLVWLLAPWRDNGWLRAHVPYVPMIPCLGIAVVFATAQWLRVGRVTPATPLRPVSYERVCTRLVGVAATFALVAFVYWLLPEYHGDFYTPFWAYLQTLCPLAILIPPYLAWADRRFDLEHDEYLAFGNLILRGWSPAGRGAIARHLLGWLVKGFFLPLMTTYLAKEMGEFYSALQHSAGGTVQRFQIFFHLGYTIDLLFAIVGYTMTLKLFDAHMRSVEPTWAGWTVALICYAPFYQLTGTYLKYDDDIYWDNYLRPWPLVQLGWGCVIVALIMVYGLSTAAFGMRFSNLTHRGIITSGPYRFTKHPAYLSKNLSWWLISIPMISSAGWATALRNCCLLGLVNAIYYARARTEERHLSRDPAYVAYALWMNRYGILSPLATRWSLLRYRPPADGRIRYPPEDAFAGPRER